MFKVNTPPIKGGNNSSSSGGVIGGSNCEFVNNY